MREIRAEIKDIENRLQIFSLLNSWSHLTKHVIGIKGGQNYWYLIEIRPIEHEAYIETFPSSKMNDAKKRYGEMELQNKGSRNNVVLVSVNSLSNLQKTYPNYFADTNYFISTLTRFLG